MEGERSVSKMRREGKEGEKEYAIVVTDVGGQWRGDGARPLAD